MGGGGAEVNKVDKPANLVGRKLFGSLGLTENILWKSRNFDANIRNDREHIDHENTIVKQGDMLKVKKVMQSGNPLSLT
jgi:hypothetical protein